MENDVLQRIREVIESKRMSVTGISKAINIPQATLYKQIAGESAMTLKTLSVLLDYFEDVSAEWLLRGKGEMILDSLKLSIEKDLLSKSFNIDSRNKVFAKSNSGTEEKFYNEHFFIDKIVQSNIDINTELLELTKKQQEQIDKFIDIINQIKMSTKE